MSDLFAKLNRLRVNAGKPELKSWKASRDKLIDAIDVLEKAGAVDILPGANPDATPKSDDPEVVKSLASKPEPEEEKVEEEAKPEPKPTPTPKKIKPALARGAENGNFTEHSRKAVQDHAAKERREKKAERAAEKATKKDAEKAERQKKHIEEKREKRKAEGKLKPAKEKDPNTVTVADIARDLGIEPKIARAKLRRHEDKLAKFQVASMDRWTFPLKARDTLVEILK